MAKKKDENPLTVGFIALGCPKAVVDSETMLAKIARAGFVITADTESADVIVINTCGFIAPAKAEALEAIENALDRKRTGGVKKVIVAGCLPQRMGRELFNESGGIDAIAGLGSRDRIAEIIKKTLCSEKPAVYLNHRCDTATDDSVRLLITPSHSVYLRISEGCDHKCSFCTIPSIRGPFRSKPRGQVIAEAVRLVEAGAVELNIIAQDTTGYGRDLKIKDGLAKLLKELEKIPQLKWIRLMYLYPAGINDRLIETIAGSEKIVHYLDIPIQHINNEILRNMRRPETKQQISRLIEKLRVRIGDVVLRTTLIAGFPGETDSRFDELVEFVEQTGFDCLGAFKYYAEAGTDAAEMAGQIPESLKEKRIEKLMLSQQQIAFAKNKNRIGSRLACLVDSAGGSGTARGRFYGQAPEIDGICHIKNCSAKAGEFVEVKITGTRDYDLVAQQI